MTICFIVTAVVLSESLTSQTLNGRMVNLSVSLLALYTAFVMLYYRLPDSIRAGVCRSAHDYYVQQKKLLKKREQAASHGGAEDAAASVSCSSMSDASQGVGTASDALSEDEAYGIVEKRPSSGSLDQRASSASRPGSRSPSRKASIDIDVEMPARPATPLSP